MLAIRDTLLLQNTTSGDIVSSSNQLINTLQSFKSIIAEQPLDESERTFEDALHSLAQQVRDICVLSAKFEDAIRRATPDELDSYVASSECECNYPKPSKKVMNDPAYIRSLSASPEPDSVDEYQQEDRTEPLKSWFVQHVTDPYPTSKEKEELCLQTGMKRTQLNMWFTNARRRSECGAKFLDDIIEPRLKELDALDWVPEADVD
ncbi:hypothetical protein SAICODRAFT_9839 [Saitoella complicata NRRL Y-17804]|nr:uncharacterized protein SAICODRAFT_9839 [Saitoella complicata NRRL Y-17804]ODQ50566.1 hypothetical protein SAICODRAFT_9839 [Saitoella complicata NRRL Y-17804]